MVKRKPKIILIISLTLAVGLVWANLDRIRDHRARAFTSAAMDGNLTRMKVLSFLGADANAYAPGRGPAIVAAGWTGQTEAVSYLLGKGVDINQKDKYEWTALMAAADEGHIETVNYLLSTDADLNAIGEEGSALRRAIEEGHSEIVALLREHGAKDGYGYQLNDCK